MDPKTYLESVTAPPTAPTPANAPARPRFEVVFFEGPPGQQVTLPFAHLTGLLWVTARPEQPDGTPGEAEAVLVDFYGWRVIVEGYGLRPLYEQLRDRTTGHVQWKGASMATFAKSWAESQGEPAISDMAVRRTRRFRMMPWRF